MRIGQKYYPNADKALFSLTAARVWRTRHLRHLDAAASSPAHEHSTTQILRRFLPGTYSLFSLCSGGTHHNRSSHRRPELVFHLQARLCRWLGSSLRSGICTPLPSTIPDTELHEPLEPVNLPARAILTAILRRHAILRRDGPGPKPSGRLQMCLVNHISELRSMAPTRFRCRRTGESNCY